MHSSGVRIEIGQRWRLRNGDEVVVETFDKNDESWPWCMSNRQWYDSSGVCVYKGVGNPLDLTKLISEQKPTIEVLADWRPSEQTSTQTQIKIDPANPKDTIGAAKLPLHLWPPAATAMGCIGLAEGMLKYGRSNWRGTEVRASIYIDACKRHIDAWFEGEENAPDSGSPHLANALACLAIIVDAQMVGKLLDDRNFDGLGYRALVDRLTPQVTHLKQLYADKNPHHYTITDGKVGTPSGFHEKN